MSVDPITDPTAIVEEDETEIVVDVTDDHEVSIAEGDWSITLTAEEARLLADALIDAAHDAENWAA